MTYECFALLVDMRTPNWSEPEELMKCWMIFVFSASLSGTICLQLTATFLEFCLSAQASQFASFLIWVRAPFHQKKGKISSYMGYENYFEPLLRAACSISGDILFSFRTHTTHSINFRHLHVPLRDLLFRESRADQSPTRPASLATGFGRCDASFFLIICVDWFAEGPQWVATLGGLMATAASIYKEKNTSLKHCNK